MPGAESGAILTPVMSLIASALVFLGMILVLIGYVVFLVAAFRRSLLWGLAVLFLPPLAALAFLLLHWRRAQSGFYLMLWGWALIGLGRLVFHAGLPWPLG